MLPPDPLNPAPESGETPPAAEPAGRELSVTEAGRRGGEKVREQYGTRFFGEIGRKGGSTTRQRHGPEHYAEIGRRGGRKTAERHGAPFYEAIGRRGRRKSQEAADGEAGSEPQAV
jgi:general stress protein YciG